MTRGASRFRLRRDLSIVGVALNEGILSSVFTATPSLACSNIVRKQGFIAWIPPQLCICSFSVQYFSRNRSLPRC